MGDEVKQERDKLHQRDDLDQPIVLPGIHRYQFISNIKDRALTKNLNRVAMLGIAATLGVDIVKPLANGVPQAIYCYECRACYATQDKCPVGISFQAELVVAARVADYDRFIRNGGLKCIRCGNCQSFCVQNLDLPKIFGTMQIITIKAMKEDIIPKRILTDALKKGLVNRQYIDEVAEYCGV